MTYLMLPEKPPDECFGPPIDKLLNGKRTFGDAEGYGKFFLTGIGRVTHYGRQLQMMNIPRRKSRRPVDYAVVDNL